MSAVEPYKMRPHWTYRLALWWHGSPLSLFWGVFQQHGQINLIVYHFAGKRKGFNVFKTHASATLSLPAAIKVRDDLNDAIRRAEVLAPKKEANE